jgi:hypothetical protein
MTRYLPNRVALAVAGFLLALMAAPSWAGGQGSAAPGAKPAAQAAASSAPVQPPAAALGPAAGRAPEAGQKPAVAKPAPVAAPAQDSYSYRAEGRRDPFVSLLNRGNDPRLRKAEGVAGLMAADVVLKGILRNRGTYLAIVQGPDGKRQYIVHPNDRFADGVVKAITADSMLILQEVNDPLSLTKQREIRKTLRAVEEVK